MRCAVIVFPGTSGDIDCYHVLKEILGQPTEYVFHKDKFSPEDFDLIVIPGGSAHGDYLDPELLQNILRLCVQY